VIGVARILTVALLDAVVERRIHTSANPTLSETNIGSLEKSRDTISCAAGGKRGEYNLRNVASIKRCRNKEGL
jgi:hypothetical protein